MTAEFESLWEKASQIHGHKCPSLFYGVTLGLMAKKEALKKPADAIILEGSSKCIRDGVTCVLQDSNLHDKLIIITDSPDCAISVGGDNWQKRFLIGQDVRMEVNSLNKSLPLPEFQLKGVAYLSGLSENELIHSKEITSRDFKNLNKKP